MEISLKREALETYKRLWSYVKPYKLIGLIALMAMIGTALIEMTMVCLLYTSPSPRDVEECRMPSSA